MLHELELGRVVRCTYVRQWPIADGQRRGSEAQAKVRDGQPKRWPATLLLMGANTCTGQPGAVDWVLNWWSGVKIDRITRWPLDQFTGWTRAPSRTNWATGPSATRDAGWPANNGRARLVPSFGSGESRLHWQLGVCGAFPCWAASPPRHPTEALPRVVARSGAFSLPRLPRNATPNTPQRINSLLIPDHSAVSRILCSLRPPVRALS